MRGRGARSRGRTITQFLKKVVVQGERSKRGISVFLNL